jgi:preprotein translocase subunit SecD
VTACAQGPGGQAAGGSRIVLEIDRNELRRQDVMPRAVIDQSIAIIERRLAELAVANGKATADGDDRIVIDIPGATDPDKLKNLANVIGKAGKLEFRLVDTAVSPADAGSGHVPSDDDPLYTTGSERRPVVVKKQVLLSGADIADAQASFDFRTDQPIVNFRFNTAGARTFGRVTQENVGRPIAIVFDGEVLSAPVIREPILGGAGQISGNFTVESAKNMAILLRTGALPANFRLVEIRQAPPRQ